MRFFLFALSMSILAFVIKHFLGTADPVIIGFLIAISYNQRS